MKDETAKVEALRLARERIRATSDYSELSKAIDSVVKQYTDLNITINQLESLSRETAAFGKLLERREQLKDRVKELRPNQRGSTDLRVEDAKSKLCENIGKWLEVLNTKNLDGPVRVDEHFQLFLGDRKFSELSAHSGSTRTRIVLAFHAAVLETALQVGGNHPGWLLFDAPRQHELADDDLKTYVERLRALSDTYSGPFQIVLAIADLAVAPNNSDVVWAPKFLSEEDGRFLGPAST